MIGAVYEPSAGPTDGELRRLYVPLYAVGAIFYPVEPPLGGHTDPLDAARVCARHVRVVYSDFAERVRTLRALCEHNDVEFHGQVVDADLLRSTVEELDSTVRAHAYTIKHLLEAPGRNTFIHIKGMRMRLDDSGVLVADEKVAPERRPPSLAHVRQAQKPEGWTQRPGLTMVEMLKGFIVEIQHMTGSLVATEEVEMVIEYLQGVLATRAAAAEEGGP